jgi:hypothetical protein
MILRPGISVRVPLQATAVADASSLSVIGIPSRLVTLANAAKSRLSRGSSAFSCFSIASRASCSLTGKAMIFSPCPRGGSVCSESAP